MEVERERGEKGGGRQGEEWKERLRTATGLLGVCAPLINDRGMMTLDIQAEE